MDIYRLKEGMVMSMSTKTENGIELTLFDGYKEETSTQLKCYESELKTTKILTIDELFQGFDTVKAITFSYDIGFIDYIMSNFQYGEIILGADFLVEKDGKLNNLLKNVLVNSYEATKIIRSYPNLVKMLQAGDVEFRTPSFVLDHRKIYLLKSDSGRTRVIKTSANMTRSAWNEEHMETYEYDDTKYCYDEYEKDFETAWINSQEIPYKVVSVKKDDDLIESNPIITKIKEVDKAIVLQEPKDIISFDNIKYVIDHKKIEEEYGELLSDIKMKAKHGIIEIAPKTVEKIKFNFKKYKKKYEVKDINEEYPSLTIDYSTGSVLLNGVPYNLNPTEEEVKSDIEQLKNIYNNFNQFVGDTYRIQESHFKMMNAIMASPFHAKLRCASKIRDIEASSLPMFLLAASSTANCGKTFMISAVLKMMTGKKLSPFNKADLSKEDIGNMQLGCKGTPVFIDELDGKSFGYIKDLIKYPERCEDLQKETMPMLIFASNNILEPDEIFRKRMVFLRFEGRLPSHIDQSAYKNMGHALIRKLGTGFYREYLRRMLDKVSNELNYIMTEDELPEKYYPDLMKMSSDTIIDILNDYGYDIPMYVRHLTWNDDYSINARFISSKAVLSIEKLYSQNRQAFKLDKNLITIEIGNSADSKKKCESWINTLPSEMKAEMVLLRNCIRITLDRKEYESRIGHKLSRFPFFEKWW